MNIPTVTIPLKHNRKSAAKEDMARNLLASCLSRCPVALRLFLEIFFPKGVPPEFRKRTKMEMQTDVCCNGSFADFVIYAPQTVFCLEVKIEAVEQVGQYAKYQEFFELQNRKTYIAGLLKSKSARKDPFLEDVTRVRWCDLLQNFGNASKEITTLASRLQALDPQLVVGDVGANKLKATKRILEHRPNSVNVGF